MKKIILLLLFAPLFISAQSAEKVVPTQKSKEEAKERIEGYRQKVLKGESMALIAALYSEDPGSASNGGRYDNIEKGQFVPEFEAVAFNLMPGEVSEVFETIYGYHFVQLVARRGKVVDVRHVLIIPK
jgi:peptidyl-prolyl cis-trans isomerase SurA